MKYELIEDWRIGEFQKKVNQALKDGAQLIGGVATMVTLSNDKHYTQAILKPE